MRGCPRTQFIQNVLIVVVRILISGGGLARGRIQYATRQDLQTLFVTALELLIVTTILRGSVPLPIVPHWKYGTLEMVLAQIMGPRPVVTMFLAGDEGFVTVEEFGTRGNHL